ncbi:hypothetical protein G9A89_011365 [Geosiphon pyriformis]|nr:hypothetical protein G9A89_011365 [Geosiphon pyriformis]
MCDYKLNSHFISRTGRVEPQARLTSFLTAGAFVDDIIWVGGSWAAMQHILNVASEFFRINDISINNDKTVAILINSRIANPSLTISGSPISITKKDEPHRYLGIFLSSEGLSTPSLAKACSNVRFFVNFVLKKAISDKQFTYLVSAVLLPIISYRTQFSFIPISVCNKWDSIVHRCLKSKSGLLLNFLNDTVYHLSLYNFKIFEQIQAKSKSAAVLAFANSVGILGHLFFHRSHDFQALSWRFCHPLLFPVHIYVSPSNNFLSDVVCIFSGCDLSLDASLASTFCLRGGIPMSLVLGEPRFLKCVPLLKHYSITFVEQLCDKHGVAFSWKTFKHWKNWIPVAWFLFVSDRASPDICFSRNFGMVCNNLLDIDSAVCLSVYTDGSLSGLGTVGMKAGAAVFFKDIDSGLGVKCVPFFHLVDLFSDSQTALDTCKSESLLAQPDFKNHCVSGNDRADLLAGVAASSSWWLPHRVSEWFLKAGDSAIFSNSRHFVRNIFRSIHRVRWEVGSSFRVLVDSLQGDVDWTRSVLVWHPDFHMAAGFTSLCTAGFRTYFMKALHHRLPVAMCKHLYDRLYSSIVCLFCGNVKISDHVFSCSFDVIGHEHLMNTYVAVWEACSGLSHFSLCVSQLLSTCASNCVVGVALCKEFVFNNWYCESVSVFKDPRVAACNMVSFVHEFCAAFWDEIWLVHVRHQAVMEKGRLIPHDGSIPTSVSGFSISLLAGVVRLLEVTNAINICFGFCRSCLFFSGACKKIFVHISV